MESDQAIDIDKEIIVLVPVTAEAFAQAAYDPRPPFAVVVVAGELVEVGVD